MRAFPRYTEQHPHLTLALAYPFLEERDLVSLPCGAISQGMTEQGEQPPPIAPERETFAEETVGSQDFYSSQPSLEWKLLGNNTINTHSPSTQLSRGSAVLNLPHQEAKHSGQLLQSELLRKSRIGTPGNNPLTPILTFVTLHDHSTKQSWREPKVEVSLTCSHDSTFCHLLTVGGIPPNAQPHHRRDKGSVCVCVFAWRC